MYNNIHEECGVFGIYKPHNADVAKTVYYGLNSLQHRGEEAAGIAVNKDRIIKCVKDLGLVSDVFDDGVFDTLGDGNMAIGHVRYSTSGNSTKTNAQPMLIKHIKGQMALAHNGNLTNSLELREELEQKGCIFHTTSDTEVISYIITGERLNSPSIEEAVTKAMYKIKGAYSLILMSPAKLIAARDPMGFKPLCMGEMTDGSIVFASESCALSTVGATFVRDILPGEIVVIEKGNIRTIKEHIGRVSHSSMCLFEYIYFSRPDSILDGISAHDFRENAGRSLSLEHPADADIVIGVPDSGLEAARGFAKEADIPYEIGLIKNKYIGRSFIAPDQGMRVDKVHMKLSAVSSVIKDKRVVLIDDSIVRGTTSKQIVKMVRDAGAKEIHMRISSPPFLNPCYYGTDIDSKENLIACKYTLEEIRDYIGADSLGYLSVDAALSILHNLSKNDYLEHDGMKVDRGYCTACFDGKYPTDIPKQTDKLRFEI